MRVAKQVLRHICAMNYDKTQSELDLLASIIERHPEGIGGDELLHDSGVGLHRRSFQRRLSALAESGRIRVEGKTRGARYFPLVQQPTTSAAKVTGQDAGTYVPMSPEGEAIKAYVRQPRHLRKPVVYRTEFLEHVHTYQPNYGSNCMPWAVLLLNKHPQAPLCA